jgi:cell division protein FtsI/penicillin-binding protein 2
MKIVATAAFAEERLVSLRETVDCVGKLSLKHQDVVCQYPHGRLTLEQALGKSCNVFFATMSARLHGDIFGRYAESFGLNAAVAKRDPGLFPKKFDEQSINYVLGLAEDLQPNALQLMRLSALVATRGRVPYMHSAEDLDEHEPPFELTLSDLTWKQIADGMQLCVRGGTAKQLDPENRLHIAAKTGTAQHGTKFQSWITGYFPIENPEHAFCVWSPNGTSQDAAVPFAKKVLLSTTW